jgi:hypothetical protein
MKSQPKGWCNIAVEFTGLPITLVMDNARYQRCRFVMDLGKALAMVLGFISDYYRGSAQTTFCPA